MAVNEDEHGGHEDPGEGTGAGALGYELCSHCKQWHAAGTFCQAAASGQGGGQGQGQAPAQAQAQATEAFYACIECHQLVRLDDVSVATRRGRALCLRCAARAVPTRDWREFL